MESFKLKTFNNYILESNSVYIDDNTELSNGIKWEQFKKIYNKSTELQTFPNGEIAKFIKIVDSISKEYKLKFLCDFDKSGKIFSGAIWMSVYIAGTYNNGEEPLRLYSGRGGQTGWFTVKNPFVGLEISSFKGQLSTATIYRYSISNEPKSTTKAIGEILAEYKNVNGESFSASNYKKQMNELDKLSAAWSKFKDKRMKLTELIKKPASKLNIKISAPKFNKATRTINWYVEEPRELRHPEEYGEDATVKLNSKEYEEYGKLFDTQWDLLNNFAKKYNVELEVSADK